MKCSECQVEIFMENYIDADDGLGERLVCVNCYNILVQKGLHVFEYYPETNYWQSVDTSNFSPSDPLPVANPCSHLSDQSTDGQGSRALGVADRSLRLEKDNR